MERIINKQPKKNVFVGLLSVILGPNDREKQKKKKILKTHYEKKGMKGVLCLWRRSVPIEFLKPDVSAKTNT